MSTNLLMSYIRQVVEGHLARVPNQLVSDDREGSGHEEEVQGEMDEMAAAIGGGSIAGMTAPLGTDPDRLGRKKNKPRRK